MMQDNVLKENNEWNDTKKAFVSLMKRQGYRSVRQFSLACGIDVANVFSNLSGRFFVSINRLFVYADVLGIPVEEVIRIFYPEETAKNKAAVTDHEAFVEQINKENPSKKPRYKTDNYGKHLEQVDF